MGIVNATYDLLADEPTYVPEKVEAILSLLFGNLFGDCLDFSLSNSCQ